MTDKRSLPSYAALLLVLALAACGCGIPASAGQGDDDHDGPISTSRKTVSRLDPDLLDAVQDAARAAQADGIRMVITSGWRSRAHQERLLQEAVVKYGSEEEASRFVSTPDTSAHVTGDAVDIGKTDAAYWLAEHGSDYGLCQIFANEIWHYELATKPGGRCPEMFADSSSRTGR